MHRTHLSYKRLQNTSTNTSRSSALLLFFLPLSTVPFCAAPALPANSLFPYVLCLLCLTSRTSDLLSCAGVRWVSISPPIFQKQEKSFRLLTPSNLVGDTHICHLINRTQHHTIGIGANRKKLSKD